MQKKFKAIEKKIVVIKKSDRQNTSPSEVVKKDVIQWHSAFYSAMKLGAVTK